ncbi:hypothetical protein HMPREF3227_02044 [Corynebacterium sp. CMW7794]|nr:hypothetical protein HMPREF3227_02044 [Corynebacterium sp. CMW7794]
MSRVKFKWCLPPSLSQIRRWGGKHLYLNSHHSLESTWMGQ